MRMENFQQQSQRKLFGFASLFLCIKVTYLIVGKNLSASKKIDAAKRFDIPIVKEDWVKDSISKGKALSIKQYTCDSESDEEDPPSKDESSEEEEPPKKAVCTFANQIINISG
jgi:hypothetical protein